jgi:hypothetical protein
MPMQAVVIVNGEVDERDVWPYATWCDSDGIRTTLTVRVHDSQELVSVLGTLTAMGLEVTSTQLMEEPGAAGPRRAGPEA